MATKEEDREEKKQRILRLIRLYVEETPRGAFITRKEFNEIIVEANIGTSRTTKDAWWEAFQAWRIILESKGKYVVNPEFLRVPAENKMASPLGQPVRGSANE